MLRNIVQKIHAYTGLQAVVGLLIFSVSAIVSTLDTESETRWLASSQTYTGAISENELELAANLHRQVGNRFEKVPQRWMISEDNGWFLVRYYSPNGAREVRLNRDTRVVEIKSNPSNLAEFLDDMHQESIGRRNLDDSLWLWAWSLYIEFSILALFALPVSGTYLWLAARPNYRYAQVSFSVSCVAMVILWNLVR